MKRGIIILTMAVLLCAALPLTAFAHGGRHHNRTATQPARQSSTNQNNTQPSTQQPSAPQNNAQNNSGSDIYPVCTVEGCATLGIHTHDGVTYACAHAGTAACGRYCESCIALGAPCELHVACPNVSQSHHGHSGYGKWRATAR